MGHNFHSFSGNTLPIMEEEDGENTDAEPSLEETTESATESAAEIPSTGDAGEPANMDDQINLLLAGVDDPFDNSTVGYNTPPSLCEQRHTIRRLAGLAKLQAKKGDTVYIIPKRWYDRFWDPRITDYRMLGPIDTRSIHRHFERSELSSRVGLHSRHTSVLQPVFERFMEWYGLAPGSTPVVTVLITSSSGSLVTEYSRCTFRVHFLTTFQEDFGQDQLRGAVELPVFNCSRLHTVGQAVEQCLQRFFEKETDLSRDRCRVRVWLVRETESEPARCVLPSTYRLSPMRFVEIPVKQQIKPEHYATPIGNLHFTAADLAVEVKESGKSHHWTSHYFVYNRLSPSSGTMGLANLGSTCHINSVLQCLTHITELRDYFLYNGFAAELNTRNPLGCGGRVAGAFAEVVQALFGDKIAQIPMYAASNFRATIGYFRPALGPYVQQDSHEVVAFLLGALHEDLNRAPQGPRVGQAGESTGVGASVGASAGASAGTRNRGTGERLAAETWSRYKLQNDSVITDLFAGMLKSTLTCLTCRRSSVTFDPCTELAVPLAVDAHWSFKVLLFPQDLPPCALEVELRGTSSYQELKEYVAQRAHMDASNLLGVEVHAHQFRNNYEAPDSESRYLPICELFLGTDTVALYEVPRSKGDIVVPVLSTGRYAGHRAPQPFGKPFFITLSEEEQHSYGAIRKKLEIAYVRLSGGFSGFPILSKTSTTSPDSMPLLANRHPEADFGVLQGDFCYATPDVPMNEFFDIKAYASVENMPVCSFGMQSVDPVQVRKEVWTPEPTAAYASAKDVTLAMDAVTRDVYNYYQLTHAHAQKPEPGTPEYLQASEWEVERDAEQEKTNAFSVNFGMYDDSGYAELLGASEGMGLENTADAGQGPTLVGARDVIVCEWPGAVADEVFSAERPVTWDRPGAMVNVELERARHERAGRQKQETTLEDCLDLFTAPEVLNTADSWYCPACKKLRQATRQIELWSTPEILLVHLKRFESQYSSTGKLDNTVRFPLTGLDMSPHLPCRDGDGDGDGDDGGRENVYDLIAVDNHFGGLGSGHYTAYVKNPVDDKWYLFDDSEVCEVDAESVASSFAYLLFYRRRDERKMLGGERLSQLIFQSRQEYEISMKKFCSKQVKLYTDSVSEEEEEEGEDEEVGEDEKVLVDETTAAFTGEKSRGSGKDRGRKTTMRGLSEAEIEEMLANGQDSGSDSFSEPEDAATDECFVPKHSVFSTNEYSVSSLEVGKLAHGRRSNRDASRRRPRFLNKSCTETAPGNAAVAPPNTSSSLYDGESGNTLQAPSLFLQPCRNRRRG